jgi:hypothetical protein
MPDPGSSPGQALIRHPRLSWIPVPRLREDKLRGNDRIGIYDFRCNILPYFQGNAAIFHSPAPFFRAGQAATVLRCL